MRDLGLSLVIAGMLGCAGMRPAATGMGGDVQSQVSDCSLDSACATGGGHGSLLLPLAIMGAGVLAIAGISYVYYLVLPDVRVTTSAPP